MAKLRNKKNKIFCFIGLLSVLLLFPVCTVGARTGETKQIAQNESSVINENTNTEKKERKYLYNPIGKTDPFESFIVLQAEKRDKENETPRTYLETLELSQLTISIICIGEKEKWAMVTDSKGDAHLIKEGTPIGLNRGVVYKIQHGNVIIREQVRDPLSGKKVPRDVVKTTSSD